MNKVKSMAKAKETKAVDGEFISLGIPGFDDLIEKGIFKGASILV